MPLRPTCFFLLVLAFTSVAGAVDKNNLSSCGDILANRKVIETNSKATRSIEVEFFSNHGKKRKIIISAEDTEIGSEQLREVAQIYLSLASAVDMGMVEIPISTAEARDK